MATAPKVDMAGAEKGSVELNDTVFSAEASEGLVHQVVVALQSAKRQGTHKTKKRGEVAATGAKPFRQKGTGRARQGAVTEPQMRGGGVVWGPRPRDYRKAVNKKIKCKALCCVLSDRLRNERLSVLEGLALDTPKTKPFAAMLDKVSAEGRKTLLVTAAADKNVVLSARNIPRASVRTADEVNALDVLLANRVIVQEEALAKLEERLS